MIINEKKITLKISNRLEFLISTKKTKASDISDYIGITAQNFSMIRNRMKRGKYPTCNFLIGISLYFDENFLK